MRPLILLTALLLASACTTEQLMTSARERAQTECNRMADPAERARCMKNAEDGYGTGAVERRVPPPR